jgi:hypothetical protein
MKAKVLFLVTLTLCTVFVLKLSADQKLVYSYKADAYLNKEASNTQIEISVSATLGVMYTVKGSHSIFYNAQTTDTYLILPDSKQYYMLDYNILQEIHEALENEYSPDKVDSDETDRKGKILNYNTVVWTFEFENDIYTTLTTVEYTTDFQISAMLDEFYAELSAIMGPMGALQEAIRSNPGVIAKEVSEITLDSDDTKKFNITQTLLSAEELELDREIFTLPEDYTETEITDELFRKYFL